MVLSSGLNHIVLSMPLFGLIVRPGMQISMLNTLWKIIEQFNYKKIIVNFDLQEKNLADFTYCDWLKAN